jgi:peptide deformylase
MNQTENLGSLLNLVKSTDKVLLTKTQPFDFTNPPLDAKQLYHDLRATMIAHNGYGLSANQCGIPYSVFVFGNPSEPPDQIISVFNPIIVDYDSTLADLEEGCLSYKFLFTKVKRPSTIKVRYANSDGVINTVKLTGLSARIFLHEYDHLQGINFKRHASITEIEKANKLFKKHNRLLKKGV